MLTQCDQEPIHLLSKIKDIGYLAVIHKLTFKTLQVSENLSKLLKRNTKDLLDCSIVELFGSNYFKLLTKTINNSDQNLKHKKFFTVLDKKEICTFIHTYENYFLLEISFAPNVTETIFENMQRIQNIFQTCDLKEPLEQIYQKIIIKTQEISDFDRVMLYKFDNNYNGQVVAQISKTMHENFLGHHFPSSDIPSQARALYLTNRFRVINDTSPKESVIVPLINPLTNEPLNLSESFLRSVSPVHIEYLKNMQVAASLSISIIINGKLWGLIVAHNPEPKNIPLFLFEFYIALSHIFSRQIEQKIQSLSYDKKLELEFKRKIFLNTLKNLSEKNFLKSLDILKKEFLEIIRCDEVIIKKENQIFSSNDYLKKDEIEKLIFYTLPLIQDDKFISNNLLQIFPDLESFDKKFAGIVLQRLEFEEEIIFLAFLRFEQTYIINWAGDPNKQVEYKNGNIVLSPRASFESWKEEVKGSCIPFDLEEIESLNIFFEKLYIQRIQMKKEEESAKLKELNKKLKIQANTDPLTLLYNQRYFKEIGIIQFEKSFRTNEPFSLILLDISDFKQIKETYGNEFCDYILIFIVAKIKQLLPKDNVALSRIGCEEFAILICKLDKNNGEKILNEILNELHKKEVGFDEKKIFLKIDYGMVDFNKRLYKNFSEMFRAAELKLYLLQNSK